MDKPPVLLEINRAVARSTFGPPIQYSTPSPEQQLLDERKTRILTPFIIGAAAYAVLGKDRDKRVAAALLAGVLFLAI